MARGPSIEESIWQLIAFLGRYGRQPMDAVMHLPMSRVQRLANAVGGLMDEEKANGGILPGSD